MEFKVTTALKKLLRLKGRKKVIQGGTSASKTYSILTILINKAITEDGQEISVVSESLPHLKRGCIRDFLKIMMALERFDANKWNKTTFTYTFSNNSYIEFFSADSESKLRGARRKTLYVNECNNIPFEAYQQLAIRTSGDIWLDYNPSASFWAITEVKEEDDTDFIILTYKDNEGLPQSIVDELEATRKKAETSEYWANWCDVYLDGNVGSLQGACIKDWKQIDILPMEAKLLGVGVDFGYSNDETAIVNMYKYNDAYIYDEVAYKKGLLNGDIYSILKEEHLSNELIYADSSEPKSIAELNRLIGSNNVLPVKKGRDSIVNGIALINQQKVYVTKSSTNIIRELRNYTWMRDKEGNTINRPIDKYNHSIDALRYITTMIIENPHTGTYNIW